MGCGPLCFNSTTWRTNSLLTAISPRMASLHWRPAKEVKITSLIGRISSVSRSTNMYSISRPMTEKSEYLDIAVFSTNALQKDVHNLFVECLTIHLIFEPTIYIGIIVDFNDVIFIITTFNVHAIKTITNEARAF